MTATMTDVAGLVAAMRAEGVVLRLRFSSDGELGLSSDSFTPEQRAGVEDHRDAIISLLLDELVTPPLTDYGNAERLVARYGGVLRYCPPRKAWLRWDRRRGRWCWQNAELAAMRDAKACARELYHAAPFAVSDPKELQRLAGWALRSESRRSLESALELAVSELGMAVQPDELDADPWLLSVANGVLDLKTAALRPARPGDFLTKQSPACFDPSATAPIFDRFLKRVVPDEATRDWLQAYFGYCLTGITSEQILTLLVGAGQNGKTTLVNAIGQVLNMSDDGYVGVVAATTLMTERRSGVRSDLAVLVGKRLVVASETGDSSRLDEPLIKLLTGGDPITCRFLYGREFTYLPHFKPLLFTNHRPVIRGVDHAIWRRMRLVPFSVRIPEDEKDPDLLEKLKVEASGILNWLVLGCLTWQAHRLTPPATILDATDDYRVEQDLLADFLDECCALDAHCQAPAGALYAAYVAWAERNRLRPRTAPGFRRDLIDRGYAPPVMATNGPFKARHVWSGIGLKVEAVEPVGPVLQSSPNGAPVENFVYTPLPAQPGVSGQVGGAALRTAPGPLPTSRRREFRFRDDGVAL